MNSGIERLDYELPGYASLKEPFLNDEIAVIDVGSDPYGTEAFSWIVNSEINDMDSEPVRCSIDSGASRLEAEIQVFEESLRRAHRQDYWLIFAYTNSGLLIERVRNNPPPEVRFGHPNPDSIRLLYEFEEYYIKEGLLKLSDYGCLDRRD